MVTNNYQHEKIITYYSTNYSAKLRFCQNYFVASIILPIPKI